MLSSKKIRPVAPSRIGSARPSGFTLTELLVVMGILASLAAILVPIINSGRRMANITASKSLLAQIEAAIGRFNEQWGCYPPDFLPSGKSFKKFTDEGASTLPATSMQALDKDATPSQALYYTLCNPYAAVGFSPYLELQSGRESEVRSKCYDEVEANEVHGSTTCAGHSTQIPEIMDRWGRSFIYRRKDFATGAKLPAVFYKPDQTACDMTDFNDSKDPKHNAETFDLWSLGPVGYGGAQWITNWK